MLTWSVRRSAPSPSSDWRRLARRSDPSLRHSERNGRTAPSPTAAAPQMVTTVGRDAACPPMIAPTPPTTRTASTGPGPRSSGSPKTSSSSSSISSRPRSRSGSRTSGPGRAGTITAARRSRSGCRSFTIVNLCGHRREQAAMGGRAVRLVDRGAEGRRLSTCVDRRQIRHRGLARTAQSRNGFATRSPTSATGRSLRAARATCSRSSAVCRSRRNTVRVVIPTRPTRSHSCRCAHTKHVRACK